jgi:hypothetical protein
MKQLLFSTLLLLATFSRSAHGEISHIAAEIQEKSSWRPASNVETPAIFDSANLSNYRSRDASIFVEYGFSKLAQWRLTNRHKNIVTVDLYEMFDPPAAYGVFTFLRTPSSAVVTGIGHLASQTSTSLCFQQNRYCVQLQAASSVPPLSDSLLELARIISSELPNSFSFPLVAEKLPKEDRVPQSEKFVMGSRALAQLIPLEPQDPFGLDVGAEAALASYQSAAETATLLLIHYPTQQLARKFLEAGYERYSAQYPQQPVFYKRDGPMVVLVLNSNSPELATTLLDKVSYVSTVSWDPKVEPPNIGEVMIKIFIFCGIMLAITLFCGLAFGILRIVIKRLFPDKVFDRSKDMEVIRLNLDSKK